VGQAVKQRRAQDRLDEAVSAKGFKILPLRLVVERTCSWIDHNCRMSKGQERLTETSEVLIYVAMSRPMLRQLARWRAFSDGLSTGS
jgi:transposase